MTVEHVDVIVVGAGLSGIGAGVLLKERCPGRTFVLLEGRERLGGTWDLFRYPGIRSDSDMHTMGYRFKPWRHAKAIADGPSILHYIEETATEYRIDEHIRYQHRVVHAAWSTKDAQWRVEVLRTDTQETVTLTCSVLYLCAGYYSYQRGYTPELPGLQRFQGPVIHPQTWPEGLDYADKRVVVIGSGATAVTLIPTLAKTAAHVTMLQRSPTYIFAWPDVDRIANVLNALLPARWAYGLVRLKNILAQQFFYRLARRHPDKARARLLQRVEQLLGPDFDIETHFHPRYNPWEQRLCLAPNGDLFHALKSGAASVVTDHIESVTEDGITLASGDTLEADILVTATGLHLVLFGGITFTVDGEPVDFANTWTYKGVASSDVPNLFACFGYVNASWTLRADLTSEYLCRVLNHMQHTGARQCTPRLRPSDAAMPSREWLVGFTPGYIERVKHLFPKQGDRAPWLNTQDYAKDKALLRRAPVDDGVMRFTQTVAPEP